MTRERINIGQACKGKWRAILPELGVNRDFLTGKGGPCPVCQGKDRFRFDDKDGRGTSFCNQCGSRDGVSLAMAVNHWDFKQAAREIEKVLGTNPAEIRVRVGPDVDQVKREMQAIWRKGRALPMVKATASWWAMRIGTVPVCDDLRGTDELTFPGRREVYHGMLAKVRDGAGNWINLHRTYLDGIGQKAALPEVRMVMPLPLPKGCAVRLTPVAGVMGVAEGIETAMSAGALYGLPVWATLTAENLTGFEPPAGCERLIIFGDHDKSLTGHWAAYTLGRKLRMKEFPCDVKIPDGEGDDWNDVLVSKMEREGT